MSFTNKTHSIGLFFSKIHVYLENVKAIENPNILYLYGYLNCL